MGNPNGAGESHNMYIGYDTSNLTTFNMLYTWSHASMIGHVVKTREPNNNLYYNLIGDELGNSSNVLDFPLGGTTYLVGNTIYKAYASNAQYASQNYMIFADVDDNNSTGTEYNALWQDLHFINNTVLLDPDNFAPAYVVISCANADSSTCPAPNNGPAVTVAAAIENNIFVGASGTPISNQSSSYLSNNLVVTNNSTGGGGMANLTNGSNVSGLFIDAAHYDFHLVTGAAAIGAGLATPTFNDGSTPDGNAVASYEYVHPVGGVIRPNVSDEGAYSYPSATTPPTLSVSYSPSQVVTGPGTITLTVTGFPAPGTGSYRTANFISENPAVLGSASASTTTSSVNATLTVYNPAATTTVPVTIYVGGAMIQASVTIDAGPGAPTSGSGPGIAGPAANVVFESGSGQSALLGSNFANPIVVGVYDANGVPVPGATVSISGAGVNGGSAVTGNSGLTNGMASITLKPTFTQASVGTTPALTVTVGGVTTTSDLNGNTITETGLASLQFAGTPSGPLAVQPGSTATLSTTLNTYGLPAGTVITFTCNQTTSFAGLTCAAPAAVTLTTGQTSVPVSVTVTATTTAKSDVPASLFHGTLPISFAALFAVLFVRRKGIAKYLLLAIAALSILGMSACTNDVHPKAPVPAAANASFVITASSTTGPVAANIPFSVIINP